MNILKRTGQALAVTSILTSCTTISNITISDLRNYAQYRIAARRERAAELRNTNDIYFILEAGWGKVHYSQFGNPMTLQEAKNVQEGDTILFRGHQYDMNGVLVPGKKYEVLSIVRCPQDFDCPRDPEGIYVKSAMGF